MVWSDKFWNKGFSSLRFTFKNPSTKASVRTCALKLRLVFVHVVRSTPLGLVMMLLVACAAMSTPQSGDADRGRSLFNQPVQGDRGEVQACSRCHAIKDGEKSATNLGTNLHDIGTRAGKTVAGQSAEDYLRTSITDPDAYLAGNFQGGLMYRGYAKSLTSQQIDDLVAYMLTLK